MGDGVSDNEGYLAVGGVYGWRILELLSWSEYWLRGLLLGCCFWLSGCGMDLSYW